MKIRIAGGGVISRRLASLLSSSGHEVTVATRTRARHALLHQAGTEPVACDALDEAALTNAVSHACGVP
jgi:Trk K+ transport system NAD-binding subunit